MKRLLYLSLCVLAFGQNLLAHDDGNCHQDNFYHMQKQSVNMYSKNLKMEKFSQQKKFLNLNAANISSKLTTTNSDYFNIKYLKIGPGAISGCIIPAYPTIGFGKRVQKNLHHGYDFSIDIHSAILINFLSLKAQYMYFCDESNQKQFYLGSGFNLETPCIILLPVGIRSVSFEITPGIQYKTQTGKIRFLQLDISQPLYMNYRFPVVGLSYGFGF